jgi:CPA2 family monovalent cation:H+ antiporter-2
MFGVGLHFSIKDPLVFAAVDPLAAWIRARPRLNGLLEQSGDPLSTLPEKDRDTGWTAHAIIVGYGRVGEIIGDGLKAQGFPFVVVDEDRRRVEELRKRGLPAIYGDARPAFWRRPARSVPGC